MLAIKGIMLMNSSPKNNLIYSRYMDLPLYLDILVLFKIHNINNKSKKEGNL